MDKMLPEVQSRPSNTCKSSNIHVKAKGKKRLTSGNDTDFQSLVSFLVVILDPLDLINESINDRKETCLQ